MSVLEKNLPSEKYPKVTLRIEKSFFNYDHDNKRTKPISLTLKVWGNAIRTEYNPSHDS